MRCSTSTQRRSPGSRPRPRPSPSARRHEQCDPSIMSASRHRAWSGGAAFEQHRLDALAPSSVRIAPGIACRQKAPRAAPRLQARCTAFRRPPSLDAWSAHMTGPASRVANIRADGGVRSRRSKIARTSGRDAIHVAHGEQRVVHEQRPGRRRQSRLLPRATAARRRSASERSRVRCPGARPRARPRWPPPSASPTAGAARIAVKNGAFSRSAAAASTPTSTSTPCARRYWNPAPAHQRIRILDRGHDARMPAATMRSTHGPVRP